jgi:hypothetical protein
VTWWQWTLLAWAILSLPAAIVIGRAITLAERRSGRVRDRDGQRRRSAEEVPPVPHPRDEEESA